MRTLELLAPAKNLECGIAAIDHGADAVYIGADRFGARAAAGNSVADIARLCEYAHRFGAKVYVTLNTIIYDDEFEDIMSTARQIADAGADAILVQDMGLAEACRGLLPLHASTQCDTRTADKAAWLHRLGMSRVVLARELSLEEIAHIHSEVPDVELEAFVHGALCVSYSGLCYASQYCFSRSANRGECAQFCRMKFDLVDADGKELVHQRHLLSLKDMCQIDHLEQLADAGVCSFKIEGRLKDATYVKNVVAAYSQRLDTIIRKRSGEYRRAAEGRVEHRFQPDLRKTFNRGFTTYFLNGRQRDIASFDTPKSLGEYVGKVKEVRTDSLTVAGTAAFANGDGLCFLNRTGELEGFRVNRAVGNRLFPLRMPKELRAGMALYRNADMAFAKLLSGVSAVRQLPVTMSLDLSDDGFVLSINGTVMATLVTEHQKAEKPQADNIRRQLTKLGNTPFVCDDVRLGPGVADCFIPSSALSDLRRRAVDKLMHTDVRCDKANDKVPGVSKPSSQTYKAEEWQPEYGRFPYTYNISNGQATDFYIAHGISNPTPAFEVAPSRSPLIMQCRHCLRYSLGHCAKRGDVVPRWHEPLFLRLADGRRFRLQFKCDECQMNIFAEP